MLAEINAELGMQAQEHLRGEGLEAEFAALDVRDPAQSVALVQKLVQERGPRCDCQYGVGQRLCGGRGTRGLRHGQGRSGYAHPGAGRRVGQSRCPRGGHSTRRGDDRVSKCALEETIEKEPYMDKRLYTVSEEEKYYFDLRGYLVVRAVLTANEIAQCNAAIDHFADRIDHYDGSLSRGSKALAGATSRRQLTGMLGWPSPFREPFRKLLVHPTVVSRLNEFSGKGFRLDHGPLLINAATGTEGHTLHGSGQPHSPATWYHQQNGKIYCQGITVAWQLTDCKAGAGGFALVPGSHKTREPTPDGVISVEEDMGLVVQPEMKAGDVLFFAETATHGTLPWKGENERRSVLYKYAGRGVARAVGKHFTPQQRYSDWVDGLTPEQQAVLYGPGVHSGSRAPVLESDGEKTWIPQTK